MAPRADVPGTLWRHRRSLAPCLLNLLPVSERLEFISTSGLAWLFYCNCSPLFPPSVPLRNESFSIMLHRGTSFDFSNLGTQFPATLFRYTLPWTNPHAHAHNGISPLKAQF